MTAGTLIGDPLVQDQEFSIHLTPPSMAASELQALQFKVTMVYNDLDGTAIQNNLNLAVLADGKPLAHGNVSEDENVVLFRIFLILSASQCYCRLQPVFFV